MNPSEAVVPMDWQPPAGTAWEGTLAWLAQQGKALYGENFALVPADYPIIYQLWVYMRGEEAEARRLGLSLRKGVLLTGPIGCGKTSLMTLLRLVRPPAQRYPIVSCREVSFAFQREGYEVIRRYGQASGPGGKPGARLFDDLGAESSLKYYGNTCNVMGEILLSRYDQFVAGRALTHLTTNLTSAELEQCYGARVRSRLREMCNVLRFEQQAQDKRR